MLPNPVPTRRGGSWGGIANALAAARDSRIKALVSLGGSVRVYPELIAAAKYVNPDRLTPPDAVRGRARGIDRRKAELNSWGYALLRTGASSPAIAIFRLATELYPSSANTFDSLAEAC